MVDVCDDGDIAKLHDKTGFLRQLTASGWRFARCLVGFCAAISQVRVRLQWPGCTGILPVLPFLQARRFKNGQDTQAPGRGASPKSTSTASATLSVSVRWTMRIL